MVENHVEKVENYPLQTTSTLYSPQLYLHSTKSRGKKQVHSQKNSFGQRIFTFAGRVGNGGEGTPPSPLPRHGRAARQMPAEPQEARLLSAWQPPTAPASPVFSAPPRRSMAAPARADRRQREAARAKQKELRICCEALSAVFFCPLRTGAAGVYFFWPRIPREAALRRFIRVFLMSLTLRASTSSEFLRMVSQ